MKKIYVVSTPIGNLGDITIRALEVLKQADVILCENPAHHLKLLNHYGIKGKRLIKITSANEKNSISGILRLLESGKEVALVSDSGTPNLSDPGGVIVRELSRMGVRCVPVPGPSSLTAAISVSPLPVSRFVFWGFIPKSMIRLKGILSDLNKVGLPVVFFVPSKHLKKVLDLLCKEYSTSEVAVFKELTKVNESVVFGKPCEIDVSGGEVVVIVKFGEKA